MADISNAKYEIVIEEISQHADIPFDLFLFDNKDDYNCYVEAVSIYDLKGTTKSCDFLQSKPGIIFE